MTCDKAAFFFSFYLFSSAKCGSRELSIAVLNQRLTCDLMNFF